MTKLNSYSINIGDWGESSEPDERSKKGKKKYMIKIYNKLSNYQMTNKLSKYIVKINK